MKGTDLFNLQELLSRQKLLICFSGPFSHSVIEELGKAVRNHLENEQIEKSSIMDVFSVYVEQAQNVRNYTASREALGRPIPANSGIVVIAKDGDHYVVSSGNLVEAEDVPGLSASLEKLRGLDKAGLKAAYKEQTRKPRDSMGAGSGAGLGLIDMARKATRPLEYSVRAVDSRYYFFSLEVQI
ncbi:SiaB family protein kinase [Azospirillum doebereinerae]|uniref:Uncharacterized protein n=1 Tax=Azospirillum doebereinerae TaxID=92933 RepID=A0A433J390_9PROT|nr:SiaB family protein kinase [Azospirillum doebereinerae]MCG5241559.1 SiaB family protein kinase [Azospirillum doebereinerae]RUQ66195.1 hypothetical protein EJ913_23385 [Azospirillum doebereinerae]